MKKRVFLALDLPKVIKEEFAGFFKSVQKIKIVKWEQPEKLHLTLVFLGFVKEEKIVQLGSLLKSVVVQQSRFSLEIAPKLSGFPTVSNPRVLWLPLEGDLEILQKIVKALQKILRQEGFKFDKRPFSVHLTLGRFREGFKKWEKEKVVRAIEDELPKLPLEFKIEGIALFESKLTSRGSIYKVLLDENFRDRN